VGHVAKHCDMLATAICLERYMKQDMSDSVRDAIEKGLACTLERTPRQPRPYALSSPPRLRRGT
jgi:hypothetical protein